MPPLVLDPALKMETVLSSHRSGLAWFEWGYISGHTYQPCHLGMPSFVMLTVGWPQNIVTVEGGTCLKSRVPHWRPVGRCGSGGGDLRSVTADPSLSTLSTKCPSKQCKESPRNGQKITSCRSRRFEVEEGGPGPALPATCGRGPAAHLHLNGGVPYGLYLSWV